MKMKMYGYSWEDIDKSYWEGFDTAKGKMEKRNEKLAERVERYKKELAKRAKQIEALNKDKDYFFDALDKQVEVTYKVIEKLIEAEEILNEFVEWANWQGNSKCPSFKSIQDKAEQFLKEQ